MEDKPTYEDLIRKVEELEKETSEHRRLEGVYRSIVESTSDSIYTIDEDCRYFFMNNHHLSRLGLQREQIIGKRYGDFHFPEKDRDFTDAAMKVFSNGVSIQQEHRSNRDNRYFLRTFSPVMEHGSYGKIVSVVVVSKDITEQKMAEDAIREN
jgi:PAS domain S-box-containing protein